ncbi:hypothetical protein WHX54_03735 [Klebsiella michiganensis]|uniref:hypothetical protein n=1 Tax=Klebsiella michiganensis TaxID=1134687 RepID=UPI0012B9E789|nr:hypothetical protein [Klebsiella michiganensis]CAE7279645.1 hypothetical protein AI2614V1_0738 [Klebsiella oxytoca]ELK6571252.1 hypothetical protein [Klebsiella michiganensis]MDU3735031.1 hypothetical protein [Klebsiella michiganensis]MDU7883551.1 hypothetical protein [Klebsiella michiganensis]CAH3438005.1 hypothetical protein AI2614V1_0738 [Klebsiella oxytoca]
MKDNIVQNIAHKLFLARSYVLEHELTGQELSFLLKEKSEGYCLKGDKLIFSSYEDRDHYVVRHYFSETDSDCADAEKTIIQTAFSIWEKSLRGDCSTAGLFLSLYEDKINVWQVLLASKRNQYEVTSLADQFIKHSRNIDINTLFNFFSVIYKKHNQYVGTFTLLGERLTNNPQKCYEIINKFHSDIKLETLHLYNIALFSLKKENYASAIDILLDDIEKNDVILSPQALWILGRFVEINNMEYRNDEIKLIIKNKIASPVTDISNAAIQATVNTIDKIPDFCQIIHKLLKDNHIKTITLLCQRIAMAKNLQYHADFPDWINTICINSGDDVELRGLVFHILSSLTEDETKHQLVISCLFVMIKNSSIVIKPQEIKSFLYNATKSSELINKIFTLALIDNIPEIAEFSRLLSTHLMVNDSSHLLSYSLPIINNFTERDFIFLVRRTLGFIVNEKHLMSSILSLLNVDNANKRTDNLVLSVISNEIAIDYPNYVIDVISECKNKIVNKKNHKFKIYDDILTHTEDYLNSLKKYPQRKEFEPPSAYVLSFQKERDKVMAKNQEISNEDSFLSKIATRIPLKAGIASFHYNDRFNTGYSEPSYLHPFSSSYSLPRRHVMDNVGYEIRTVMFKTAKKDTI